jgi:hypothetical protein
MVGGNFADNSIVTLYGMGGGLSGWSGISGYSGMSGYSGWSGYSGLTGVSGYNATSGYSGFSGMSGALPPAGNEIARIVTSGSQSTVDFTSIPTNFRDIEVRYQARSNVNASAEDLSLKINNDGTSGNYTGNTYLVASGTTTTVASAAATAAGVVITNTTGATSLANHTTNGIVFINNYIETTFYKKIQNRGGYTTSGTYIQETESAWKSTAAINRLTFSVPTSFVDGSTFVLYGIGGVGQSGYSGYSGMAGSSLGANVNANEAISSTSYVDLATPGPSVSLVTGSTASVQWSANIITTTTGNTAFIGVAVTGATTVAPVDSSMFAPAIASGAGTIAGNLYMQGLNPGLNTFTLKYRVDGGTHNIYNRGIFVSAYGTGGISGYSGWSGYSGISGFSGYSGYSGLQGSTGGIVQAFTSQTSVTMTHNFAKKPVVNVIDNTGAVIVPYSIIHASDNAFTVTFTNSTTGSIIASIGGTGTSGYSGSVGSVKFISAAYFGGF